MSSLDSFQWATEARGLLHQITQIPDHKRIQLYLRHSHRLDGVNWEEISKLRLTNEGKFAARMFGRELPKDREYCISHSPVMRCQETAECIAEGIKSKSGSVHIEGKIPELAQIRGDPVKIGEIFDADEERFMGKWAKGMYPSESVEPMGDYAKRIGQKLWPPCQQLQNSNQSKSTLNKPMVEIYITHDLMVMAYEAAWCGKIRDFETEWVQYLGGFILIFEQESIVKLDHKSRQECSFPDWAQKIVTN